MCDSMKEGIFIGFDRDSENLSRAKEYLYPIAPNVRKEFLGMSFANLAEGLQSLHIEKADVVLYDL